MKMKLSTKETDKIIKKKRKLRYKIANLIKKDPSKEKELTEILDKLI